MKVWWCEEHRVTGPGEVLCEAALFNSNFGPEDGRCRMVEMQLVPGELQCPNCKFVYELERMP